MKNKNFIIFFKTYWAKFVLIIFCFILLIILSLYFIPNWIERKNFVNDVTNLGQRTSVFSLSKVYCYSSASGINNNEGKAMWDLNISQYTDIALSIHINNINNNLTEQLDNNNLQVVENSSKYSVSSIYIDNINFSNNETGNLSLSYIPILNFGLLSDDELFSAKTQEDKIVFNIVENKEELLNNIVLEPSVDENLILPITLRYLNCNIKLGYIINNIEENLIFDGSILKRASIPLSSIKNEISFTIHIVNKLNETFSYDISLQIPLQNDNKSIYDGSISNEIQFDNCYFY